MRQEGRKEGRKEGRLGYPKFEEYLAILHPAPHTQGCAKSDQPEKSNPYFLVVQLIVK
jgi:hypothetical protein